MFDWDDLRVFLSVARERTLSGAAQQLRVDQTTIGRRLGALEQAVGARLLERTSLGYALTAAGESVLASVENIESQTSELERKLLGQDARIEGRVRLATSDTLAAWLVLRHLPALRALHEGLVIELVTGNRPADLARREADVSLRPVKPTQPSLLTRRLGKAAWALYASEDYIRRRGKPVLRSGLAGHDVIGFGAELAGTVGGKWLEQHGSRGRTVLVSNSLVCQAQAVVSGLGVCALPCLFGDVEPALRRLQKAVIGEHELWLVVHPDVRTSARVRVVAEYLTTLVREQEPLLSGRLLRGRSRPRS